MVVVADAPDAYRVQAQFAGIGFNGFHCGDAGYIANACFGRVEACQKVAENRYISMNIKSTSQFWLISIENSVAEAVDITKLFQKNGGYTSKSDSSRHGIGTYSMKQTVESYGAVLKADCTDSVFTLEIMIDKTTK